MGDFSLVVLFCLIVGHALADYPLQGDFLARAKTGAVPGVPKWIAMFMHSIIHAGAVYLLSGWFVLAIAEFVSHWAIDELKNRKYITFTTDQVLHVGCKVVWTLWIAYAGLGL